MLKFEFATQWQPCGYLELQPNSNVKNMKEGRGGEDQHGGLVL